MRLVALLLAFVSAVAVATTTVVCPAAVVGATGPLTRTERLYVALRRLAAETPAPASLDEAYDRLVEAFRATERMLLPDSAVASWGKGTRAELVDEAFRVYDFRNGDSEYDENAFPKAFSQVLKPPAMRYQWKKTPTPGLLILFQLEHITIFHASGATEIQRIDPEVRKRLADRTAPSVVAVHDDQAYLAALPTREDLVIFRKPGRDGRGVW